MYALEKIRRTPTSAVRPLAAFDLYHLAACLLQDMTTQRSSPKRRQIDNEHFLKGFALPNLSNLMQWTNRGEICR